MDLRRIAILGLAFLIAAPSVRAQVAKQAKTQPRTNATPPAPKVLPEAPELLDLPAPAPIAEPPALDEKPAKVDGDVQVTAQVPIDQGPPPAETIPIGPQGVNLSVEVQADPVTFLMKEGLVRVVLKNAGKTEARGVVVRDVLPDGLEFVDGQSPQPPERSGQVLTWNVASIAAGSQKVLTFKVKPTRPGPIDHAVSVSLRTAARARSVVQQPKLRVEQSTSSSKVLKGDRVQVKVSIHNPGTGVARNVLVQARLSTGLRHSEKSRSLDLKVQEIQPSETIELTPLVFEAVAGGMQTCEVVVSSPDVVPAPEDQAGLTTKSEIEVLEPMLNIAIQGPERAYTRMSATYRLLVQNPGTAPIKNVVAAIFIPEGGRLSFKPPGSSYTANDRNLSFTVPRVEPKEKLEYEFQVELGGVQLFKLSAQAKVRTIDRVLESNARFDTDVQGKADVRIKATERKRVLDINEIGEFEITLENLGDKEATQVIVSAELTKNLKVEETDHDADEQAKFDPKTGRLIFPVIPRMPPKSTQRILIRTRALEPGVAKCQLTLNYDNEEPIPFIATTRIEALSNRTQR